MIVHYIREAVAEGVILNLDDDENGSSNCFRIEWQRRKRAQSLILVQLEMLCPRRVAAEQVFIK